MANSDRTPSVSPQLSVKEGQGPVEEILGLGGEGQSGGVEDRATSSGISETVAFAAGAETKQASGPTRPSLVQLGSSSVPGSSTIAPHPKRFSAVNINKKFLEKNSSPSGSSAVAQGSTSIKPGSAIARPQAQPSSSHSRLVTTKLTSISPASSASGAGWSRPSSVAPPNGVGSQSPNSTPPHLPGSGPPSSSSGPIPLPHPGKVIQPQPRPALIQQSSSQKDHNIAGSNKPVWGNVKPAPLPSRGYVRQNDFPTAAEVAQVVTSARIAKLNDSKEAAENAAATKQARMEEADTFRGVHLDPNAHHWDEMEEDDDNFLDGVIEFGDGRQYKVAPTDIQSKSPELSDPFSSPQTASKTKSRLDEIPLSKDPSSHIPVTKEERFADDFDRSWPRSGTSPATTSREFPSSAAAPISPISPVLPPSANPSQEWSRVLFNERSNRLEPYSNAHRQGTIQHIPKRNGHQEYPISPTELRNVREFPGTSPSHNSIQLLQKPGSDLASRSRKFSGGNSVSGIPHARDREQIHRRDGPPQSPRMARDGHNLGLLGKDGNTSTERGRRGSMGPPTLPPHTIRGSSRDGGRQLPPHLSQVPPRSPILPQGRLLSRDSEFPPQSSTVEFTASSPSARRPSQSPALSHASATRISPTVGISPLPQLSAPELDEVRKDLMQSAAARAKQRRQQEEEEREKEKERARKKAAELEERMKVAEAEKAQKESTLADEKLARSQNEAAVAIIEEAVKSVDVLRREPRRPPPLTGVQAQPTLDSERFLGSRTASTSIPSGDTHPLVRAESWRSKARPLPPLSATRQAHPRTSVPPFLPPPSPAAQQVDSLLHGSGENLEIVDFSDLGKFVGHPEDSESLLVDEPIPMATPVLSSVRPVASDFFDDRPSPGKNNPPSWRQNQLLSRHVPAPILEKQVEDSPATKEDLQNDITDNSTGVAESVATKEISVLPEVQIIVAPPYPGHQRTPRTAGFYKEATMSALDDAMSRIKGALDGMQASEQGKEAPRATSLESEASTKPSLLQSSTSQKERWIPPALRSRTFDSETREVFHVTRVEPPRSPKPAWSAFVVKLPLTSQSLEPVSKKQLSLFLKPVHQTQWEILSFEPPVEGMSRRDLSLNDVLFRKQPGGYRGKLRYRVVLPRLRPSMFGPRVNLPTHPLPLRSNGAFGRPAGADGMTTWRKAAPGLDATDPTITSQPGLNTISRSPPPDLLSSDSQVNPTVSSDSVPPKIDAYPTHAKSKPPKMPAGSAVAFYRDSRIDIVEEDLRPSVNFIVTSELEDSRQEALSQDLPTKAQPNITVTSPSYVNCDGTPLGRNSPQDGATPTPPISDNTTSPANHDINESRSSGGSPDRIITPPNHIAAPWARASSSIPMKESPARGPDPEHLKAVWSQTSNKAGMQTVNSLEGIADDLTALPFTIQEVKSEDGETPPPSVSAAPSRMSLHDVTRAFQQVPPSSSSPSTSLRTPPLAAPPASRPPNYAYGLPPPPPNNMRPTYAAYTSPMMSHSPAPGIIYPIPISNSPVPNRMPVNGHPPIYNQTMWMSMPAPAPPNQANMMRPMTSPYPTQLIPYPPGTPIFAPQPLQNMQNSPQQNGAQLNRSRSMSMMSPVIPHAQMYGSPVLMHTPVMQPPQNQSYVPGRGQTRADNGQMPHSQHPQQINHQPSPHPGYNHSSFARPW